MRVAGIVKDYIVKWLPYLVKCNSQAWGDIAFIETVTLMNPLEKLEADYTPVRCTLYYRSGSVNIPLQPTCYLHKCFLPKPVDKPPVA